MTGQQYLFSVLRSLFCQTPLPAPVTFEEFCDAYRLAQHHNLAHLLYYMAQRHELLPPPTTSEETDFLKNAARKLLSTQYLYARIEAELDKICEVLTAEQIAFMPMKGALLSALYPEPWMRTRCDIDLLVHEADLVRALETVTACGYTTDGKRNYHNVSLFCGDVHLELHYSIMERHEQMDAVLERVWEHAVADGCRYTQTPAFFRFHHIAHMAHHLLGGGCGVRSVIDLWLLRRAPDHDEEAVCALCEQAGLLVFYRSMCRLTEIWFGDGTHDEQTQKWEAFILNGGTFGTHTQRLASVGASYSKRELVKRFLCASYNDLKIQYPSLEGKPYLTPLYRPWHVLQRLLQGKGGEAVSRIRCAGARQDTAVVDAKEVLTTVGLVE